MKEKPVVAGIGELLWDVLPSGKQLGGAPCNFAFHAMQAGCDCFVLSAIGKDDLGTELKVVLNELNLSDRFIQSNEFPTSTVTVGLDINGHPDYTIHENVAWDHIRWNNDMQILAKELDAVCFGSLAQRNPESEYSIKSLISSTRDDCLKVFDINLRQNYYSKNTILNTLLLSDVLKLNENELPVVAGYLGISGHFEHQLDLILDTYKLKYIVYTLGSKGSIIKSKSEFSYSSAPVIQVADTIGAGDCFTAIFIAGVLKGIKLEEVHKKATELSAFICTQKGATPKLICKVF